MKSEHKVIDSRLVGTTAEHIFLSLVNQHGVFAASFNTAGFDGVVFDPEHKLFKVGDSPFYIQIKCRGSDVRHHNAQGHSQKTIEKISSMAKHLGIPDNSLYFVVGFFNNSDIRNIVFFAIPFSQLQRFKKKPTHQYRFSVKLCEEAQQEDNGTFRL
jgi:hypothetical protein